MQWSQLESQKIQNEKNDDSYFWTQFHQRSTYSFYASRFQKHKKTVKFQSFLRFQDL